MEFVITSIEEALRIYYGDVEPTLWSVTHDDYYKMIQSKTACSYFQFSVGVREPLLLNRPLKWVKPGYVPPKPKPAVSIFSLEFPT